MSDWKEVYSEILSSYVGRNEILAGVKSEILKHEPEDSVGLPPHLRVAIRRVVLPHLDPEDQDDEIAIIQHILAVTRKSWAESCEGEDAREEKARPTKAGDYKKAFMAFTAAQRIFKEEMDAYDRERRDTKDPKTIGKRNRIIQQWWESVSDERKAEAGRAVEKWNKLGAPKPINRYRRKNLSNMARDLIETVHRTMGSHVVMFVAHEAGEGQIKMVVFETAPANGKKAFTQSSESSKDWVLNGENSLTDYLLTAPVEDDSAEKHDVEISLDEDGNPEMPTWVGQKLKVQQNLARAVLCEEEVGEEGVHSGQMMKSGEVVNKGAEANMDVRDQAPEECSPAWHASKDHIQYLKSLSIMPRYQVPVDLVEALPEQEHGKGREVALPHWATWTWSAKYLPQEIHLESACFGRPLGNYKIEWDCDYGEGGGKARWGKRQGGWGQWEEGGENMESNQEGHGTLMVDI
ncbi:hypothetical protein EDC04DRAFT_2608990 [Pisolithus marmoratus]|nr:hypothetical protein EDC04DRAFT_2608990 [Pisolithus marmoratus]